MSSIWIFPTIASAQGGVIRGRVWRRDPDRGRRVLIRNARSLMLGREWPGARVRLAVGTRKPHVIETQADDEGFFRAPLPAGPAPWPLQRIPVVAFIESHALPSGHGAVTLVPETGLSLISDFDDTIAVTHVRRRLRMLHNALLRDETRHRAVAGMGALYRALHTAGVSGFFYLSGTPVGLLRRTQRFLALHRFPHGAITLRHMQSEPWSGLAYKRPHLEAIVDSLPGHRFLLVGDTGEKDPEAFAGLRERLGARHLGTFLRRVGGDDASARRFAGATVFDAPHEAARGLVQAGLLPAAAPAAIERAEHIAAALRKLEG